MNMKKTIKNTLYVFFAALSVSALARESVIYPGGNATSPTQTLAYNCAAGTAQTLLDINNVKTTILNGGDMWWDLSTGRYEIPKGSGKHSLFSGALWIGGLDDDNQLKVAAQRYRQSGNDYWPGPLDNVRLTSDGLPNNKYGTTEANICAQYDQHFVVTRAEVEEFIAYKNSNNPSVEFPDYVIPSSILDYPGNREYDDQDNNAYEGYDDQVGTNPYYALETLAPYRDVDGDGSYNPSAGDYPEYNLDGSLNCKEGDMLFGDQTLWWVYNDNGEAHTASGSVEPIGLEIQAQAFAFSTNDEINNMTFYNYKMINRSHNALNETYFGVWVDPDLGNWSDDYVGCDVARGLGYCYNGDEEDEGATGYGANPPAIGVDFFRGPIADEGDNIDNDLDGEIDEPGEQIIMSKFVYHNNDATITGGPSETEHYYNYLKGIWKDGSPITYGGNGYGGSDECNYMFPGDTDPEFAESWTEQTANNLPADRRFLQSAGPFTLEPGAVNTITTGVVWARASSGGAWASVELMRLADDKAQKLFDICFEVLDGPDAPDMVIQELDEELIVSLSNAVSSNNFMEGYVEADEINIFGFYDDADTIPYRNEYVFEGYQVFQLKDETVTATDVYDVDKARLVFQCDVKNFRDDQSAPTIEENDSPIADLVNYNYSQELGADVPQNMTIEAANDGITHTFSITQDLFATGDRTLINHRTYYYTVIAYAYNEYLEYSEDVVPSETDMYAASFNGQKKPFLAGRKNIKQYSVIPHIPNAEADGTIQNAEYGTIPAMTRLEGYGNGGLELEFTTETRDALLSEYCLAQTGYALDGSPVNIKVVDPLKVPQNTEFTFMLDALNDTANWVLTNETTGEFVQSNQTIAVKNEQIISEWGLSVMILNGANPGDDQEGTNGLLSVREIKDDATSWLDYVRDLDYVGQNQDGYPDVHPADWIRSGTTTAPNPAGGDAQAFLIDAGAYVSGVAEWADSGESFEGILNGSWAPYKLVAKHTDDVNFEHAPSNGTFGGNKLQDLHSVDIVYTSDKSLWTRVPVIETGDTINRLELKASESVDKEGNPDGTGNGFSWFPGYALDLEKGTRLNMMFGEASNFKADNGDDMMWNPTSTGLSGNWFREADVEVIYGGRHYVYVMMSTYAGSDETAHPLYDELTSMDGTFSKNKVFKDVSWVSIPLLSQNATLLDGDITTKIRLSKAYDKYNMDDTACEETASNINEGRPYLTFNTDLIQTVTNDTETAKSALDLIKVVPNPYYASNSYETGQLDNRVKITNLPKVCTISIYSISGTLIRKVSLDNEENSKGWDWDLKNDHNISIASGVYIIHVDAGEFGEKVLKWFGALRPIDLDSF